MADGNLFKE